MRPCDFDGAQRVGKPRDWDDSRNGECLDIFITKAVDDTGLPISYSVYQLSDDEIRALAGGGVLRLGIVGYGAHPVFQLHVLSPEIAAAANLRPQGDLGDVVNLP